MIKRRLWCVKAPKFGFFFAASLLNSFTRFGAAKTVHHLAPTLLVALYSTPTSAAFFERSPQETETTHLVSPGRLLSRAQTRQTMPSQVQITAQ